MHEIDFAKGHGTRNDFVLFTDSDGRIELTDAQVRGLCDRRAGVGGDGILRAVRGRHVPEWDGDPDLWFMDYRNADGSTAAMCGNGLRVFARYLVEQGLAEGPRFRVGTRAGERWVALATDQITAGLDEARVGGPVAVVLDGVRHPATKVDVGSLHAVTFLPPGQLDALDLTRAPSWEPAEVFPDGVNVEFVEVVAPDRLRMRVHERGIGETLSCGTGSAAAAAVHASSSGWTDEITVDVPGGSLSVRFHGSEAVLTGPAVIVAHGRVDLDQLAIEA